MWRENKLKEIKDTYQNLELSKEQRANIKYFGEFMAKSLAKKDIYLDSIVVQGFISFAIRDWNNEHPGKDFAAEARGPNGFQVTVDMIEMLKKRLRTLLRDQNDWDKIDKMVNETLAEFQKVGLQKG